MKKRDIIIVTVCIATALICIVLTFWGNYKNDGVLSPEAFYGVLATFIGICATIIVGFQIASFVKIHETERQIKKVQDERDRMEEEKKELQKKIDHVELQLSNAFVILSEMSESKAIKCLTYIASISCGKIEKSDINITHNRYKALNKYIKETNAKDKAILTQFISNLESVDIPKDVEHYTEIMKLHIEIMEILEKAAEEKNNKETKQTK